MKNTKMIKTNKGIFEMGVGQVVEAFEPMVKKFVKECNYEITTYEYDNDDYFQYGMETLCEAYKDYDYNKGSFSTFLTYQLRGKKTKIKDWLFADKRGSGELSYISLDNVDSDEDDFRSMDKYLLCEEDGYLDCVDMSIFGELSKKELSLIPVIIKDLTITDYSNKNNISRVTVHKHLTITKKKIENIFIRENMAINL